MLECEELYFRKAKRNCHCKVCDREIKKETEPIIIFRTIRGNCDTVHVCLPCIEKMNKMISTNKQLL